MLKQNIIANFSAKIWIISIGLITTPVHLQLLGGEAYGFVGLLMTFSVITTLFDFGISHVILKESATCYKVTNPSEADKKNFLNIVTTLKYFNIFLSVTLFIAVLISADLVSTNLLELDKLQPVEARQLIVYLGAASALIWYTSFYRNILIGIQMQVWLSKNDVVFFSLKHLGAIVSMHIFGKNAEVFFIHIILVTLLENIVVQLKVYKVLKIKFGKEKKFSINSLKKVWRYALSTASTSVVGMMVSQADVLLLPAMLPMKEYGYYMTARVLGRSILHLTQPLSAAYRPRLMELAVKSSEIEIRNTYFQASRLAALAIIPAAILISIFSKEILLLWTQNSELAKVTNTTLSLLVLGTMINALMNIAYSLQLAHGWTSLALKTNIVMLILLFPLMKYLISSHGMVGTALSWFIINLGYLLIVIPLMHRRLLTGEASSWYLKNLIPVLLISALLPLIIKFTEFIIIDVVSLIFLYIINMLLCIFIVKYWCV